MGTISTTIENTLVAWCFLTFASFCLANDFRGFISEMCISTPWKSKTKQRMVFGMIHVKDSLLPMGKVWSLDFLGTCSPKNKLGDGFKPFFFRGVITPKLRGNVIHNFWAIYNDLSRGHPKWWFSRGTWMS